MVPPKDLGRKDHCPLYFQGMESPLWEVPREAQELEYEGENRSPARVPDEVTMLVSNVCILSSSVSVNGEWGESDAFV